MLEIASLVGFIIWSVREFFVVTINKENILENGVNNRAYVIIRFSLILYIILLLVTLFHNHYIEQKNILLLFVVLLTVPGILFGYITKKELYTSGTDIGNKCGIVMEHVMYGGFAVFFLCSIIFIFGF